MGVHNIGYNHLHMTSLHYKSGGAQPLHHSISQLKDLALQNCPCYKMRRLNLNLFKIFKHQNAQRSGLETPRFT